MTTTAIIGDIHGRSDLLQDLVWNVRDRFGSDVRIIAVGDFIDRGPDSKGVIDIAVKEGIEGLLGNHEVWLVNYLLSGTLGLEAMSPMIGGEHTIRSYAIGTGMDIQNTFVIERDLLGLIPESHQKFLKELALVKKVEVGGVRYWVSHGGIKASAVERVRQAAGDSIHLLTEDNIALVCARVELDSMIWEHFDMGGGNTLYRYEDGSVQVFGHSPQRDVQIHPWYITLDTGSGRTTRTPNVLSAVVLTDDGDRHVITDGVWVSDEKAAAVKEMLKEWD